MKIFISDIHLGDGSKADDFHRDKEFLDLLYYVDDKNAELIILGDLYELWQSRLEKIMYAHPEICKRLHGLGDRVNYIYGNHDYLPFSKIWPEAYLDRINGLSLFACHGHQLDFYNNFENPLWNLKWPIGRYITLAVGLLERLINPDIDTWLQAMRYKLGTFTVEAAEIQNKGGIRDDAEKLYQAMDSQRQSSQGVSDICIFGHTHEPMLEEKINVVNKYRRAIYANCGAWTDDAYPTFIALTKKKIQLCDGYDYSVLEEIGL